MTPKASQSANVLSSARVKGIVHELNLHFFSPLSHFLTAPSRTEKRQKLKNDIQSLIADKSANAQ